MPNRSIVHSRLSTRLWLPFFTLIGLVVGLIMIPVASAQPAGWSPCSTDRGTACLQPYGFGGQSAWGYPVDGTGSNCTNYVAFRLAQRGVGNPGNLGNGDQWAGNARAKGIAVDQTPRTGAVAQWTRINHVAYVDGVSADGNTIWISESHYGGGSDRRSIRRGTTAWPQNFIHFNPPVNNTDSSNLIGSLDEVRVLEPGRVRVRGWGIDRDHPNTNIDVHFYVGDEGFARKTNVRRDDVHAAHGMGWHHGYQHDLEVKRFGRQEVCAFAINYRPRDNKLIGCKAVTIANPHPQGKFEAITSEKPGTFRVRGWAFDPNDKGRPVVLHVYVGGAAGEPGAANTVINTTLTRSDVNEAHGTTGKPGFDATISTNKTGQQKVCVYAINWGAGHTNPQLGCKTATIAAKPAVVPGEPINGGGGGTGSLSS